MRRLDEIARVDGFAVNPAFSGSREALHERWLIQSNEQYLSEIVFEHPVTHRFKEHEEQPL